LERAGCKKTEIRKETPPPGMDLLGAKSNGRLMEFQPIPDQPQDATVSKWQRQYVALDF
jgi:hypothetical protein